jgi:23S rRNA pseudouridine1911/1915/1917 synthase
MTLWQLLLFRQVKKEASNIQDKPAGMAEPEPSEVVELSVSLEGTGLRADKYLAGQLEYSRNLMQEWLRQGRVLLDGKAAKASTRLKAGQSFRLLIPPLATARPQPDPAIPLRVIFEDPHLLVLDKQRGLVVHPAAGNPDGTLVNALLAHCPDWSGINGVLRPGIVHRLDKHTSGLMVVAKSDKAHSGLQQQFQDRSVLKIYQALVWGVPHPRRGRIDQPLARDPKDRLKMSVQTHGKGAVSDYEVKETFAHEHALVEVRLWTGRTHQIRVHLAWLGFPLVGDAVYGKLRDDFGLSGQALHCSRLGFAHPLSGQTMEFEAPLPEDMRRLRETLADRAR